MRIDHLLLTRMQLSIGWVCIAREIMVTYDDRDLALPVRKGDRQAFGELVRHYQYSVFTVCYRLTGETREAEDLAQEAFGRAFQRFHHYDPKRPFSPWMRRVAANYCRNHLGVQRLTTSPLGDERHAPKSQNEASPESLRLEGERYEMFRAAIISLLPHDQLVIELSN